MRDKKGKCKGYAFVEMATAEGATRAAVKFDGISINDRELTVNSNRDIIAQKTTLTFPVNDSSSLKRAEIIKINQQIVKAVIEKQKSPGRFRAYGAVFLDQPSILAVGDQLLIVRNFQ